LSAAKIYFIPRVYRQQLFRTRASRANKRSLWRHFRLLLKSGKPVACRGTSAVRIFQTPKEWHRIR